MKAKNKKQNSGNNIQIEWISRIDNEFVTNEYLTLRVFSLNFQSEEDYEWRATFEGEQIWVKMTKPFYSIEFSENFPIERKSAAIEEVNRITRQFN
jgi:hypothetical protein